MTTSSVEIMNRGMQCLMDNMGIVEAERFISLVIREKFDYTKWQCEYFDKKPAAEISLEAAEFEKANPFNGSAIRL